MHIFSCYFRAANIIHIGNTTCLSQTQTYKNNWCLEDQEFLNFLHNLAFPSKRSQLASNMYLWCWRSTKLFWQQNKAVMWNRSHTTWHRNKDADVFHSLLFVLMSCFFSSLWLFNELSALRLSKGKLKFVKLHQTAAAGMCLFLGYFYQWMLRARCPRWSW